MKIELEATENGTVTVWRLDADEDHWVLRAIDRSSITCDTLFPTRDDAMAVALKLAAEAQPDIVTEGRIEDAGTSRPAPDDNPKLRDWQAGKDYRALKMQTRAVDVSVVATEQGAAIRWCREDRALIMRQDAPTVVIDGVTYTGPVEEVVEEASPWFRRETYEWSVSEGWEAKDRVFEVPIYVARKTMRFAVLGGA